MKEPLTAQSDAGECIWLRALMKLKQRSWESCGKAQPTDYKGRNAVLHRRKASYEDAQRIYTIEMVCKICYSARGL